MVGFDVVRFLVMARKVTVLVLVCRRGGFIDYDVSGLVLRLGRSLPDAAR